MADLEAQALKLTIGVDKVEIRKDLDNIRKGWGDLSSYMVESISKFAAASSDEFKEFDRGAKELGKHVKFIVDNLVPGSIGLDIHTKLFNTEELFNVMDLSKKDYETKLGFKINDTEYVDFMKTLKTQMTTVGIDINAPDLSAKDIAQVLKAQSDLLAKTNPIPAYKKIWAQQRENTAQFMELLGKGAASLKSGFSGGIGGFFTKITKSLFSGDALKLASGFYNKIFSNPGLWETMQKGLAKLMNSPIGAVVAIFSIAKILEKIFAPVVEVLSLFMDLALGPIQTLLIDTLSNLIPAFQSLGVIVATFAEALRPIFTSLSQVLSKMLSTGGLQKILQGVAETLGTILSFVTPIFSVLLGGLGWVISSLMKLDIVLVAIKTAVWFLAIKGMVALATGIWGAVVASAAFVIAWWPVFAIVGGIALLVVGLKGLFNWFMKFEGFANVIGAIVDAVKTLWHWITGNSPGLMPAFMALGNMIFKIVTGPLTVLKGVFRELRLLVVQGFEALMKFITGVDPLKMLAISASFVALSVSVAAFAAVATLSLFVFKSLGDSFEKLSIGSKNFSDLLNKLSDLDTVKISSNLDVVRSSTDNINSRLSFVNPKLDYKFNMPKPNPVTIVPDRTVATNLENLNENVKKQTTTLVDELRKLRSGSADNVIFDFGATGTNKSIRFAL